MQTLEIAISQGSYRRGFQTHADQLNQTTAKNGLFAEEVGLVFLAEVGFEDASVATDGRTVGQADFEGTADVFWSTATAGHAAAFGVLAAHGVARALGRHHDHIDTGLGLDQAKMHV